MKRRNLDLTAEAILIEPGEFIVLRGPGWDLESFCATVGEGMRKAGRTGPEYHGGVILLRDGHSIESIPRENLEMLLGRK